MLTIEPSTHTAPAYFTRVHIGVVYNCGMRCARWETAAAPDPDGIQLEKIQAYLREHTRIKWVWYDYACLPQGQRTAEESAIFKRMLNAVNMLYLGCSVLLLVDSSYPSRFWTQFEAWLSMQTCAADGLATAADDIRRWTLVCILGAKPQWEGDKLETMWRRAKADFALAELSRRDVTVTNQSDKDAQLPKIKKLDDQVRSAFSEMHGRSLKMRELAKRKRGEAAALLAEATRLEQEADAMDAQVDRVFGV